MAFSCAFFMILLTVEYMEAEAFGGDAAAFLFGRFYQVFSKPDLTRAVFRVEKKLKTLDCGYGCMLQ